MRTILIFGAILIGVGTIMAQMADRITPAPAAATLAASVRKASVPETVSQAAVRSLAIPRDARGHFETEGRIDGQRIAFMVDTGASVIALTERDAGRLGYHPAPRDYVAQVRTANGTVRAAPVKLDMVEVGGVMVRDVDAIVMADKTLSENLLGLSFLSRLHRFEYREGRLVLEE